MRAKKPLNKAPIRPSILKPIERRRNFKRNNGRNSGTEMLTGAKNFMMWWNILEAHGRETMSWEIITGESTRPEQPLGGPPELKPYNNLYDDNEQSGPLPTWQKARNRWDIRDGAARKFLLKTIARHLRNEVTNCRTSFEVYKYLLGRTGHKDRGRIHEAAFVKFRDSIPTLSECGHDLDRFHVHVTTAGGVYDETVRPFIFDNLTPITNHYLVKTYLEKIDSRPYEKKVQDMRTKATVMHLPVAVEEISSYGRQIPQGEIIEAQEDPQEGMIVWSQPEQGQLVQIKEEGSPMPPCHITRNAPEQFRRLARPKRKEITFRRSW